MSEIAIDPALIAQEIKTATIRNKNRRRNKVARKSRMVTRKFLKK